MTIEEIRANAPDGATHYMHWEFVDAVDFVRVVDDGVYDSWYNEQ